jgi:hypothetical protein
VISDPKLGAVDGFMVVFDIHITFPFHHPRTPSLDRRHIEQKRKGEETTELCSVQQLFVKGRRRRRKKEKAIQCNLQVSQFILKISLSLLSQVILYYVILYYSLGLPFRSLSFYQVPRFVGLKHFKSNRHGNYV